MTFDRLKAVLSRSVRFLVIAFACTLMVFSNAFPAAAISSPKSDYSEGDAHLDMIQEKSEEVLKSRPLSLEQTQSEANKGVNEIQGAADVQDMKTPQNAKGVTAEQQLERALEKVTGRD